MVVIDSVHRFVSEEAKMMSRRNLKERSDRAVSSKPEVKTKISPQRDAILTELERQLEERISLLRTIVSYVDDNRLAR